MKLNIRGEKVTVTQSMKNYITEKLSKISILKTQTRLMLMFLPKSKD